MTPSDAWETHARDWITWVRKPGHDSYDRYHRDQFVPLVPPAYRSFSTCGRGSSRPDDRARGTHVAFAAVMITRPQLACTAMAFAFAAGCAPASENAAADGNSLVMQNDAPVPNGPAGESDPASTPGNSGRGSPSTRSTSEDGGAPPPADAGPTGCALPNAYLATLPDPVIAKGGVSYGPGGPSSGIYFRATTTSHAYPMAAPHDLLYVEKGVFLGGPTNAIEPTGYRPIGGCTTSSNLVSCSANEYFSVFGSEHPGANFRIAALTQTHNPKYGYGNFELAQIDPVTGATTRFGRYAIGAPGGDTTADPDPSGPPIVVATGVASHGDDVVVVGTSNVGFAGEYGTGSYFFMWFGGFLAPACDGATVYAGSIARGTVPFVP